MEIKEKMEDPSLGDTVWANAQDDGWISWQIMVPMADAQSVTLPIVWNGGSEADASEPPFFVYTPRKQPAGRL